MDRLQLPTLNSNVCVSTAGNASSPVAQGSGSSLVNITLDHPSSSCVPSIPYSHWFPSYYDWEFPYPYGSTPPISFVPPPIASSPHPPSPPPMANDNSPFKLHFVSGNISKCVGCGNMYAKPPIPPYDLCVQHRE